MIEELIDSAVIIEELSSTDVDGVLNEVLQAMVGVDRIARRDADDIVVQLRERERQGSTGIGNGMAVPHVKTECVERMAMALARSRDGIDYRAIDGRPVHTVFLIVAPVDRADDHLQALRWISTLARNADFRRFVRSASGEDEIRDLLHEMSAPA